MIHLPMLYTTLASIGLLLHHIVKIATRITFHNGLRSTELYLGIITLNKGHISAAGQRIPQVADSEFLVFFGEFTSRYVKDVGLVCLLCNFNLQGTILAPGGYLLS